MKRAKDVKKKQLHTHTYTSQLFQPFFLLQYFQYHITENSVLSEKGFFPPSDLIFYLQFFFLLFSLPCLSPSTFFQIFCSPLVCAFPTQALLRNIQSHKCFTASKYTVLKKEKEWADGNEFETVALLESKSTVLHFMESRNIIMQGISWKNPAAWLRKIIIAIYQPWYTCF